MKTYKERKNRQGPCRNEKKGDTEPRWGSKSWPRQWTLRHEKEGNGAMGERAVKKQVAGLSGHAMNPAEPGYLSSVICPRVAFSQHCSITWRKGQGEFGVSRISSVEGKHGQI